MGAPPTEAGFAAASVDGGGADGDAFAEKACFEVHPCHGN